jgi:hypothetical protein
LLSSVLFIGIDHFVSSIMIPTKFIVRSKDSSTNLSNTNSPNNNTNKASSKKKILIVRKNNKESSDNLENNAEEGEEIDLFAPPKNYATELSQSAEEAEQQYYNRVEQKELSSTRSSLHFPAISSAGARPPSVKKPQSHYTPSLLHHRKRIEANEKAELLNYSINNSTLSNSSWSASLRGFGDSYVSVGHLFTGLYAKINPPNAEKQVIIRYPSLSAAEAQRAATISPKKSAKSINSLSGLAYTSELGNEIFSNLVIKGWDLLRPESTEEQQISRQQSLQQLQQTNKQNKIADSIIGEDLAELNKNVDSASEQEEEKPLIALSASHLSFQITTTTLSSYFQHRISTQSIEISNNSCYLVNFSFEKQPSPLHSLFEAASSAHFAADNQLEPLDNPAVTLFSIQPNNGHILPQSKIQVFVTFIAENGGKVNESYEIKLFPNILGGGVPLTCSFSAITTVIDTNHQRRTALIEQLTAEHRAKAVEDKLHQLVSQVRAPLPQAQHWRLLFHRQNRDQNLFYHAELMSPLLDFAELVFSKHSPLLRDKIPRWDLRLSSLKAWIDTIPHRNHQFIAPFNENYKEFVARLAQRPPNDPVRYEIMRGKLTELAGNMERVGIQHKVAQGIYFPSKKQLRLAEIDKINATLAAEQANLPYFMRNSAVTSAVTAELSSPGPETLQIETEEAEIRDQGSLRAAEKLQNYVQSALTAIIGDFETLSGPESSDSPPDFYKLEPSSLEKPQTLEISRLLGLFGARTELISSEKGSVLASWGLFSGKTVPDYGNFIETAQQKAEREEKEKNQRYFGQITTDVQAHSEKSGEKSVLSAVFDLPLLHLAVSNRFLLFSSVEEQVFAIPLVNSYNSAEFQQLLVQNSEKSKQNKGKSSSSSTKETNSAITSPQNSQNNANSGVSSAKSPRTKEKSAAAEPIPHEAVPFAANLPSIFSNSAFFPNSFYPIPELSGYFPRILAAGHNFGLIATDAGELLQWDCRARTVTKQIKWKSAVYTQLSKILAAAAATSAGNLASNSSSEATVKTPRSARTIPAGSKPGSGKTRPKANGQADFSLSNASSAAAETKIAEPTQINPVLAGATEISQLSVGGSSKLSSLTAANSSSLANSFEFVVILSPSGVLSSGFSPLAAEDQGWSKFLAQGNLAAVLGQTESEGKKDKSSSKPSKDKNSAAIITAQAPTGANSEPVFEPQLELGVISALLPSAMEKFTLNNNIPLAVGEIHRVVSISSGYSHVLALSNRGLLFSWGSSNEFGQLSGGEKKARAAPALVNCSLYNAANNPSNAYITKISSGSYHNLLLTNHGRIFAFGRGSEGQLGLGDTNNKAEPTEITAIDYNKHRVVSISAGNSHSLAIVERLINSSPVKSDTPAEEENESKKELAAERSIYSWGRSHTGALGNNTPSGELVTLTSPTLISASSIEWRFPSAVYSVDDSSFALLPRSLSAAQLAAQSAAGIHHFTAENIEQ